MEKHQLHIWVPPFYGESGNVLRSSVVYVPAAIFHIPVVKQLAFVLNCKTLLKTAVHLFAIIPSQLV